MKKLLVFFTVGWVVILVIWQCLLVADAKNAKARSLAPATNAESCVEIGWRPMVGQIKEDKASGVSYVTVAGSGDINDTNNFRVCLVNACRGVVSLDTDTRVWRVNEKTGKAEVYVVTKEILPYSRPIWFVVRDAKDTRANN